MQRFSSLLSVEAYLNSEQLLVRHMLENYRRIGARFARPVHNYTDQLTVQHGIALQSVELDPENHRAILNVWQNFVSSY